MLIVPGSVRVKMQAEAEGLDEVFVAAGAEWREAGCSMCLAMNPDKLDAGGTQRVARRTATSRAGRVPAAARTSCHRPSPLPPR